MLFYCHAKSFLFAFASCISRILLAMKTCFPSKHLSPTDITKGKFEYTCSVKPRRIIEKFRLLSIYSLGKAHASAKKVKEKSKR